MTIVCLLSFEIYSEAFDSTDWDLMSHCGIFFDQDGILICFMYGQIRALRILLTIMYLGNNVFIVSDIWVTTGRHRLALSSRISWRHGT